MEGAKKEMLKGENKTTESLYKRFFRGEKEAVAELEAKGYLNDTATATREAERAARKLWGKRRISASLFGR